MKKIFILGSVVSPCPPGKQGGTERVAYYQAKDLAEHGLQICFVCARGSKQNFQNELEREKVSDPGRIISNIEFIEIGGGTAHGNQQDALKFDLSFIEASRKMRIEIANLTL